MNKHKNAEKRVLLLLVALLILLTTLPRCSFSVLTLIIAT